MVSETILERFVGPIGQPTIELLLDHPQMSSPANLTVEISSPQRGRCVGDPTSFRDMALKMYISGGQPLPYKLILYG